MPPNNAGADADPIVVDEQDIARITGLSQPAIRRLRKHPDENYRFPASFKFTPGVAGKNHWFLVDVLAYLERLRALSQNPTDEQQVALKAHIERLQEARAESPAMRRRQQTPNSAHRTINEGGEEVPPMAAQE